MSDTPSPSQQLTARQAEVLAWITDNRVLYGPTIREIAQAFAFKSPNAVTVHLRALERKGKIRRRPHAARGIEVVQ